MQFGFLVRGNGKTYLEVRGAVPKGNRLRCRATLSGKRSLPACVVQPRSAFGNPVAVVASIKASQTVVVEMIDDEGVVVESMERTVNPVCAAFESKYNGLIGKEGIELVRNVDVEPCAEEPWIHVERIIGNDHGEDFDIVRGKVQVLVAEPTGLQAPCSFEAYDDAGNPLSIDNVIVRGDSVSSYSSSALPCIRTIAFSFEKPRDPHDFFIGVSFYDSGLSDGFAYIGKRQADRLRWDAYGLFNPGGDGIRYHDWFIEHHRSSSQQLALQRAYGFSDWPLFSIIVPLFETPIGFFREMVESVLDQTYGNFELILVNASPEDAELCRTVERYERFDDRIVSVNLDANLGITLNTNAGIKVAKGDFLCFFDHDDVLEPDILFEYARALEEHPQTDLLYCDEDKLLDGRYVGGFFKPDYDPMLILASNYVCHMLAVRKALVDALDELPGKQFDGSQDHNLTMLIAERARNVFHVRKILYHWRMHAASTAGNDAAKPWTLESGRLAVEQHLSRIGVPAEVSNAPGFPNCYLVDYRIPRPLPRVSAIVVSDDAEMLKRCVASLGGREQYADLEVVVAWRGNCREAEELLGRADYARFQVVSWHSGETSLAAFNRAAGRSLGSYLMFMGHEIELDTRRWTEKLLGPVMRPDVVACGPRIVYRDDVVRQTGILISDGVPIRACEFVPRGSWSSYTITRFARMVSALEVSCMLVDRDAYEQVGGFDEDLDPFSASLDFCFKLQERCGSIAIQPQVEAYYHEEGGVATDDWRPNAANAGCLKNRWPKRFACPDARYNPNYAPGAPSFALEVPRDSVSEALQSLPC